MRKTSTPASHKRQIRCGAREAGPRVATIFTRRRRRMLSPLHSWPSQHDALCVQQTWEPLCVSVGVNVYIRRVCHTRQSLYRWVEEVGRNTGQDEECAPCLERTSQRCAPKLSVLGCEGRAVMMQSTPESAQQIRQWEGPQTVLSKALQTPA